MASLADRSKAMRSVLAEFKAYYSGLVDSNEYKSPDEEDRKREDRLRVSAFPYCGLKHLHKRLNCDEEEQEEEVSFGMKYYTSVGTQTHRYIQYVLGHGTQILGHWKCLTKGCEGTKAITFRNMCPVCKRPMEYEELTVRRGKHLTGHIDGVWRAKDGRYYIVDYKTSSVDAIQNNPQTGFMPYPKNVAQIVAYCALIEQQYNIEISGWILMYVARDNPMKIILPLGQMISRKTKKKILRKVDIWSSHYQIVMTAFKFKQLMQLVEEKPCKTFDQYLGSAYHSAFQPCPLGVSGICFKQKMLIETLRMDWETKPKDWKERKRPAYLKKIERSLQMDRIPSIEYTKP
jgi:hypothetical protein